MSRYAEIKIEPFRLIEYAKREGERHSDFMTAGIAPLDDLTDGDSVQVNVAELIKALQDVLKRIPEDMRADTVLEFSVYGDYGRLSTSLSYAIWESEEDFDKRAARERARAVEVQRRAAALAEARERELFAQLKRKYEP